MKFLPKHIAELVFYIALLCGVQIKFIEYFAPLLIRFVSKFVFPILNSEILAVSDLYLKTFLRTLLWFSLSSVLYITLFIPLIVGVLVLNATLFRTSKPI
jgi:hypothetical protein